MAIIRTAMIDDDGTGTTGTILNNAWKQELYGQIDAFVSNGGVWTPYTPVWSGSGGTAPTLGNGTLTGEYMKIGNWVDVSIVLELGSTTAIGSHTYWDLSLPFPALKKATFFHENTFRCGAVHVSGAAVGMLIGYAYTAMQVYALNVSNANWGPATPFAWVAGSMFTLHGSYRVA